jgi:hypothetical protein
MTARVGDFIESVLHPDPGTDSASESYAPTPQSVGICARIAERLAAFPGAQPGAFVLAGEEGTGKRHLLRRAALQIEPLHTRTVSLPLDPGVDLAHHLAEALGRGVVAKSAPADLPDALFASWLLAIASRYASAGIGMVVIDDASPRLAALSESQRRRDTDLLRIAIETFAPAGVLVAIVWDAGEGVEAEGFGTTCEVARLSRDHLAETVSKLSVWSLRHDEGVRAVLGRLAARLPDAVHDPDRFLRIYPLHPRLFELVFRATRRLPGFAPLAFLRGAIDAARSQPADALVTIDALYEAVAGEPASREFAGACDELRSIARAALDPERAEGADRVLKALAVETACGPKPPSAAELAGALMWDAGAVSSLLEQISPRAGSLLDVLDGEPERRYRILPLRPPPTGLSPETLEWAACLLGSLVDLSPGDLRIRLLEWWSGVETAFPPDALRGLPDSLATAALFREVRSYELFRRLLESLVGRMRAGEMEIEECVAAAARGFNQSRDDLAVWRLRHEAFSELIGWAESFERERAYLLSAFVTGNERLEKLRADLLEQASRPLGFLERPARESFDRGFREFHGLYAVSYSELHDKMLNIAGDSSAADAKVDTVALRNLELLSKLHYSDKSHVNRVHVIGKWLETWQCTLPASAILDSHPRCYCNFNPWGTKLGDSVAQLNEAARDGITYFRSVLRNCNQLVIHGLKAFSADDADSRQIAALMSRGPMAPLRPQSIEILNRIIRAHSDEFSAAFKSHKP